MQSKPVRGRRSAAVAALTEAAVRAAAKAEAESVRWDQPSREKVYRRLDAHRNALLRADLIKVVDAEFADSLQRQRKAILAEGKAMMSAANAGRLNDAALSLSELERRVGCRKWLLSGAARTPGHRFHEVRNQCLALWGKTSRKGKSVPQTVALSTPSAPRQQRFCRCCNTKVMGKATINGYLPECWAEYQRVVAIDEGRMARLSA